MIVDVQSACFVFTNTTLRDARGLKEEADVVNGVGGSSVKARGKEVFLSNGLSWDREE